jgi:hypothetical protein
MRSITGREKACTVPASVTDWGITLYASSPWTYVIFSTAVSTGRAVDVAPRLRQLAVQARHSFVDGQGCRFPRATSAHVIRANDLRRRTYQPQPNGDWRLETRPASVKNTEPPPVPG